VLRVLDAGPRPLYRAALASLAVACLLTVAIALTVRPAGRLPGSQQVLIAGALAGLALASVLGLASLWWPPRWRVTLLDRVVAPSERATIWLALAAWFPALLIPVYFRARSTQPLPVHWIAFGYLDKRWETAAYLAGALAPVLLLVAAARIRQTGRDHPRSWRAWLRGMTAGGGAAGAVSPDARWARAAQIAARVLTGAALAYYFYGPPWYLDRNTAAIGYQDDVYLGGLQAIYKGHLPYIGPAAIQYGPGTQLLSYLFMRHIGTFSVLGFRESWALFQWAGATVFFVTLFLVFGYARGLAMALLAALIYPTLTQLGFRPGHTYAGFFGWANPLRYAGAFALIVFLPAIVRRCPRWRGLVAGSAVGLLWGALSYLAQENLIAGLAGALAVAAVLLLSGTAGLRAVRTALLAVLAGFLLVWLPVLGYYAVHGELARFVWLYFLIPRAVAGGYSNTAFRHGLHNPWAKTFYVFPFVLAMLALLSVCRFRPFRIATDWSRDRILLLATLIATIVLYEGALLRSDTPHLSGPMLPVPALVVMAATALPRLLGARRRATLALTGAALVAAAFALLPTSSFALPDVGARLAAPYLDRVRLAGDPAPATPVTLAGQRVGAGLETARTCCQRSTLSMPRFDLLMDRIHMITGNRVTDVVSFPNGYPGLIYFVADLNPAPIPLEPYTMVLTQQQRRAFLATYRKSVLPRTQALVTSSLAARQARYFLRRYPDARRIALSYRGRPYYVILQPGPKRPVSRAARPSASAGRHVPVR